MGSTWVIGFGAIVIVGVLFALRTWARTWGATVAEIRRQWPGDELSPQTRLVTTRALTIDAPPAVVWQWVVQIGQDRAGFYSYTWLENLFGCVMPRVEHIVPEWQHRTLGDIVWHARRDRYRASARQIVVRLESGRVLSLASPADWGRLVRGDSNLEGSWTFTLRPASHGRTRLIVRTRGPAASNFTGWLFWIAVLEPAHFIMERRMMLRIRELAETNADQDQRVAS